MPIVKKAVLISLKEGGGEQGYWYNTLNLLMAR